MPEKETMASWKYVRFCLLINVIIVLGWMFGFFNTFYKLLLNYNDSIMDRFIFLCWLMKHYFLKSAWWEDFPLVCKCLSFLNGRVRVVNVAFKLFAERNTDSQRIIRTRLILHACLSNTYTCYYRLRYILPWLITHNSGYCQVYKTHLLAIARTSIDNDVLSVLWPKIDLLAKSVFFRPWLSPQTDH